MALNIENTANPRTEEGTIVEKYILDLKELGLSSLQAKLYIGLLKSGPCSARVITNALGINRVDSYRTLKSLVRRGLVEIVISNPSIYTSSPPDLVVRTLVSEKERQLIAMRTESQGLQSWLDSIKNMKSALIEQMNNHEYTATFTVKHGGQTFDQYQKMFSRCKREILLVWSVFGLHMHHEEGTLQLFKECYERGIRILGITEKSAEHRSEMNKWSRYINFRYVRSMEGKLRYLLVDSSELMLAINHVPCDIKTLASLITMNRTIVRGFEMDFYNLWNSASPLTSIHKRYDSADAGFSAYKPPRKCSYHASLI